MLQACFNKLTYLLDDCHMTHNVFGRYSHRAAYATAFHWSYEECKSLDSIMKSHARNWLI